MGDPQTSGCLRENSRKQNPSKCILEGCRELCGAVLAQGERTGRVVPSQLLGHARSPKGRGGGQGRGGTPTAHKAQPQGTREQRHGATLGGHLPEREREAGGPHLVRGGTPLARSAGGAAVVGMPVAALVLEPLLLLALVQALRPRA